MNKIVHMQVQMKQHYHPGSRQNQTRHTIGTQAETKGKKNANENKQVTGQRSYCERTIEGGISAFIRDWEFESVKNYLYASKRVILPKLHIWVSMQKKHLSCEMK